MKVIKTQMQDGQCIAFKQYGSGGVVFLLLHGIPGSSHVWSKVATELSKTGVSVLVPDLLGFGESSRPTNIAGLWLDAQAKALINGLEQLGIESFHLVGHDYGGPVSVTLYKMVPEKIKSLTLLSTNTFTDTPIPFPLALIKVPLIGIFWTKVIFSKLSLRMMLKQGMGDKTSHINTIQALGDEAQTQAIATIFSSALKELSTRYREVEDLLPRIKVPATVIWGTKDPFFSVKQGQRTADAIPGAQFIILSGAGHFLPEEKPSEIVFELKKLI